MSSPGAKEKVKRGYRACLHCRSRKAKCDLGDIDAPSDPPCSRCRRESRECIFAPSRRGGNNSKRRKESIDTMGDNNEGSSQSPYGAWKIEHRASGTAEPPLDGHRSFDASYNPQDFYPGGGNGRMEFPPFPKLRPQSSIDYSTDPRNYASSLQDLLRSPQSQTNPYPSALELRPHDPSPTGQMDLSPASNNFGSSSTPHRNSLQRPSDAQTPSPKRRRLHLNPPLHAADPSSIVVADMQNESDALHILALASGQAGQHRTNETRLARSSSRASEGRPSESGGVESRAGRDLRDYALVKLGIATVGQITLLAERFFKYRHHLCPMVPSAIIPRTPDQLSTFARNERYLLAAIVIIASRHAPEDGMRELHDRAWGLFRGWLSDIQCLGAPPTIGLVEALLLLAENLPRDPTRTGSNASKEDSSNPHLHAIGFGDEVHGAENRQAWALIGMAIRNAYGLGIDKLALKLFPEAERTLELERARLAWTYCYLFDRHVSLRLGLAFWSRGPAAVCFQGFSSSAQTGPAAAAGNFPFLREIKAPEAESAEHPQEDLASLVQAYLELTQLMSNAHDVLYPNAARTRSLVVYGEYFKYIDELARSLDGFKVLWREKKWNTFPLTDAVWTMFYYVQLYICAFSFQAHVERAAMRAEEEYKILEQQHKANGSVGDLTRPPLSLFPRGAAASPDARYIFQSCDAARTLLHICVDRLSPGGALPFMPNRFLLWFTYAAIVLLKALYSGAMLRADHAETLKLIDRLVACFSETSKDEDHPAVRYGRQLESLKKKLSGMSDNADAPSPTGGHTVPLPPIIPSYSSAPIRRQSNTSIPMIDQTRTSSASPYAQALNWTLPVNAQAPAPVSFAYPNTPNGLSAYVAPPHAQPLSEVANIHPGDFGVATSQIPGATGQNNLGFPVLEDWFSGQVESSNNNETNGAVFPSLDLQDFWMKVGPGEAQGGFPFR